MWVSVSEVYVVLVYAGICTLFVQSNFLPDLLSPFVLKITPSENKKSNVHGSVHRNDILIYIQ